MNYEGPHFRKTNGLSKFVQLGSGITRIHLRCVPSFKPGSSPYCLPCKYLILRMPSHCEMKPCSPSLEMRTAQVQDPSWEWIACKTPPETLTDGVESGPTLSQINKRICGEWTTEVDYCVCAVRKLSLKKPRSLSHFDLTA